METITENKNYRSIGSIGILGGLLLIAAAILILFSSFHVNVTRDFWGNVTGYSYSFPNAIYSVILGVLGFIMILAGYGLLIKGKKKG